MLDFLDISREFYVSALYLVIEIFVIQILAFIFLKLLITKFQ